MLSGECEVGREEESKNAIERHSIFIWEGWGVRGAQGLRGREEAGKLI